MFKAADVVGSFHGAASPHGSPASLLTDNEAVFTAVPRKGMCAIELETARLGIRYLHSSPYHPQTWARSSALSPDAEALVGQARGGGDERGSAGGARPVPRLHNDVRPHRAIDRRSPSEAFDVRPKAAPSLPGVRRCLRMCACAGTRSRVLALVDGLRVRVLTEDGELIRELVLDPNRDYQPHGRS